MIEILEQLLIDRLQVNYINLLLNPVIVSDCTSPICVIIFIFIGDITLEIPLLFLTLLSAREILNSSILFHFT